MTDSALSLAAELIEAIPCPVCLYLINSDLLIPNSSWRKVIGPGSRLIDLQISPTTPEDLDACIRTARQVGSGRLPVILSSDLRRSHLLVRQLSRWPELLIFSMSDEPEVPEGHPSVDIAAVSCPIEQQLLHTAEQEL